VIEISLYFKSQRVSNRNKNDRSEKSGKPPYTSIKEIKTEVN